LVVEDGRIIERGTHESLYAASGRYYDLYTKQHAVQENLFLAPGEGEPEPLDINGEKIPSGAAGRADNALPDAINLIRGQTR
jgi:subfamily B ATP-binding cassette protein MsbA